VCRAAGAFFIIALVIAGPIKIAFSVPDFIASIRQNTLSRAAAAVDALEQGGNTLASGDFVTANQAFEQANIAFSELEASLGTLGSSVLDLTASLPMVGPKVGAPLALIEIGKSISFGSTEFSRALESVVAALSATAGPEAVRASATHFRAAHAHLASAAAAFSRVEVSAIPENLQGRVAWLRDELSALTPILESVPERMELVFALLGYQERMRYLVFFENNAELRPTGGFAGSFALLDIDRGKIVALEIPGGGTYDLQGSLPLRLAAPEPLQRLRQRWEFQDANWFADWPTSAQTLIAFYEKSGGPTVHGAIALTTTALEELLRATGPVTLSSGVTVDAESAFLAIQREVESKQARKSRKPKALLGEIAPRVLEQAFTRVSVNARALLPPLERIVRERHLQIYLKNPLLERTVIDAGLGGEMRSNARGDFLAIIRANIGGGKSDRVIEDRTEVTLTVGESGELLQTVTLRRTHRGIPSAPFVGVPNISYARFYVPEGSVLRSARGFTSSLALMEKTLTDDEQVAPLASDLRVQERAGMGMVEPKSRTRITREFGKTVFGNWIVVDPGNTVEVELTYTLPWTLTAAEHFGRYTLLVQKQAGTVGESFHFHANIPSTWEVLSSAPEGRVRDGIEFPLDRDRVVGMMVRRSQ
jgi:hypothetical protein